MDAAPALLSLAIALFVVVIIRWIWKRYDDHQFFKRRGIPGPQPSFLLGNTMQIWNNQNEVMTQWIKKYGNVFGYFMGDVPYLLVNDIDVLKQILIKDFQFFNSRPTLFLDIPPLNHSMFSVKADRWKEVRSLLSPTFSSGKIKLMSKITDKKIDITLDVIGKKAEKNESFDIYRTMQALTLDVIAHCAFGMNTRCQDNPNDYMLNAARDFIKFQDNPTVLLSLAFPFINALFKKVGQFLKAARMTRYILQHLKFVIDNRRKNPTVKTIDLLQLLLNSSDSEATAGGKIAPLSDAELMANAYSFLIAGYETTSTALGFTFFLLTQNPEIQERLYEEIQAAEDASYNTVQSLQYLDQILSESLRLYPPVTGFVSRACNTDYTIDSIVIPKGSMVICPVWDIHHNPDLWPDPFKFDPDRFSPGNKSNIKNMAYLPFGAGPRNCIGSRFAQLEAKQTIFKLIQKYKFEMCEKGEKTLSVRCVNGVLTQPAKGVWVKAVPRK